MKKTYSYRKEKKQNPFVGLTSFQHFNNGELYSDLVVLPENNLTETEHVECYPIPDYVSQKGRAQGYYPDCSVAYFRVLWKEFEPEEEKYNYSLIEDLLKKARESSQSLMLRIMPHSTRESDDVPQWLKYRIPCPSRPAGKRVKDSPRDKMFLFYFGRAIRALGEAFDGDETLSMLDVSLPGAWGEGCDIAYFEKDELLDFAAIYTDVFKNTLLIGQIGAPWLVKALGKSGSVGWRADCIGPDHTYKMMLPLTEELCEVWKSGHVSFESYWWLGEWERKGWDVDALLKRMLDWHVSTFNAKSLPIPNRWREKIDDFVSKMGYHFVIKQASVQDSVSAGSSLKLSLTVENRGVAPIYRKLPLYIKIKGESEALIKTEVDITRWLPGEHEEGIELQIPVDMAAGSYSILAGIGAGALPRVYFATDARQDENFAELFKISVTE